MTKMWTSERVLLQVCAGHLEDWANRLSACDEPQLVEFAQKLAGIANDMLTLHARSRSRQMAPDELP